MIIVDNFVLPCTYVDLKHISLQNLIQKNTGFYHKDINTPEKIVDNS